MLKSTVLALGSRLKLLSDGLFNAADLIYRENNLQFQSRWFPIVYLLHTRGALGITEIANELSLTHSAVSQMSRKIIQNEIITEQSDQLDNRRRLLVLTEEGRALCGELEPIWDDILFAVRETIRQAGIDLMNALARFEKELEKENLASRVSRRTRARRTESVEIVEYRSEYRTVFRNLNFEWLEKYFYVEPIDNEVLSDPEKHIISPGGSIFFARLSGELVGLVLSFTTRTPVSSSQKWQ